MVKNLMISCTTSTLQQYKDELQKEIYSIEISICAIERSVGSDDVPQTAKTFSSALGRLDTLHQRIQGLISEKLESSVDRGQMQSLYHQLGRLSQYVNITTSSLKERWRARFAFARPSVELQKIQSEEMMKTVVDVERPFLDEMLSSLRPEAVDNGKKHIMYVCLTYLFALSDAPSPLADDMRERILRLQKCGIALLDYYNPDEVSCAGSQFTPLCHLMKACVTSVSDEFIELMIPFVEKMLEKTAEINDTLDQSKNALLTAVSWHSLNKPRATTIDREKLVFEALLRRGADPFAAVSTGGIGHATPFGFACFQRQWAILDLFEEHLAVHGQMPKIDKRYRRVSDEVEKIERKKNRASVLSDIGKLHQLSKDLRAAGERNYYPLLIRILRLLETLREAIE